MAHGHLCQECKCSILSYSTICCVFKVQPNLTNQKLYGNKLFVRANYTLVCPDCPKKIVNRFSIPENQLKAIEDMKAAYLISKGRQVKLDPKKGDDYRATVMKKCGVDPQVNIRYKVYRSDDFVGPMMEAQKALGVAP